MNRTFYVATLLLITLVATACHKEAGTGGTASIEGRVLKIVHDDDNYDMSVDTMAAAKQDVFIVYGDDTYFGDDIETSADGRYRFRYLNPGTYTVFAYSELASGERVAVNQSVTLKRGEAAVAPDIYIDCGKANGTSMVKGWLWCHYFDKNGDEVRASWALGERVYIQRVEEDYYFDNTRVGMGGIFYFQKLQPGDYIVYALGQYPDETPYAVSDTVRVEESGHVYETDTLTIRLKA